MSSKRKYDSSFFHFPLLRILFISCSLIIAVFCFLLAANSFPQIIDRVVAVVNDQVITLTDLRIAEAFGLYEDEREGEEEKRLFWTLERMINQKIVFSATREDISVEEEELQAELRKVTEKLGSEGFQKRLEEFGLGLEDLGVYLEDKILYQNVLSRRFSLGVTVNLEEIQNHYEKTYIPYQKKKGLKPRPMMEVLDEIELAIKKEKTKKQIAVWIDNLKKKAEIEIRLDDLDNTQDS